MARVLRLTRSLRGRNFEAALWASPMLLWLVIFFLGPLILLLITSFWTASEYRSYPIWNLGNYKAIVTDSDIYRSLFRTLWFAASTAIISIIILYPFAYAIAFKVPPKLRLLCLGLTITPFFASYLMRDFSWILILGENGIINGILRSAGLIGTPIKIIFTEISARIGILSFLIPLCTVLLYLSLARVNRTLLEAASNLGARPWWSFLTVTLPLAKNGLVLAGMLAFVLAFGDFVSPVLLGGGRMRVLSMIITEEARSAGNWPQAAAIGVMMIVLLLVIIMVIFRLTSERQRA